MKHSTHWQAPVDHPAYLGHFPGTPIVPGVMLLDAALHIITGGLSAGRSEVRSLKFLSSVTPGESLLIEHESTPDGAVRFEISCGARKVASGVVVLGITS